jgi:hypothetical protein
MLRVGMAEDLHRVEDLLKVERIAMHAALRRPASKVGTSTFGAQSSGPQALIFGGQGAHVGRQVPDCFRGDRSTSCTTRYSFRLRYGLSTGWR